MKKSIALVLFIVLVINTASHSQWQKVNTLYGGNCSRLIADGGILYGLVTPYISNGMLYKSLDNGLTWDSISLIQPITGSGNVSISADNGLLLITRPGTFYFTVDTGTTWAKRTIPFSSADYKIEVLNGVLYRQKNDSIFTSMDTGLTWQTKYTYLNTYFDIQKSDRTIFAFNHTGQNVLSTSDSGNSWQAIIPNFVQNYYKCAAKKGDTIAFVSEKKLSISSDGGANWTNKIFPYNTGPFGSSISLVDSFLLFVDGDKIYKSADLGSTWVKIPGHKAAAASGFIKINNEVLAQTTNFFVQKINLLNGQTEDRNKNVADLNVNRIITKGDSIFLTTANSPSAIFYSYDNGTTWNHSAAISFLADAIAIDPNGNLYLTYRRCKSIFRSTDGAKTWAKFAEYPTLANTYNMYASDTLLFCATKYKVFQVTTDTTTPAVVTAIHNSGASDITVLNDSIYILSYGVYVKPIASSQPFFNISGNLQGTNITIISSNGEIITGGNRGCFKTIPPNSTWSNIKLIGKNVLDLKADSAGNIYSVSDLGVSVLYKNTTMWNPINFHLPRSFVREIALNSNSLYVTSSFRLWQRPMSVVLTLGINDFPNSSELIEAYPNPANTAVTVTLNASANQNYTLNIFDVTGRNCYSEKFAASINYEKNIDVRFLEDGCYIFQFHNGSTAINKKIIVHH